jgi:hypothetical protein
MRFWRERIKPFWVDYGWFILGGIALSAFLLGIGGFQRQPDLPGQETGFWDSVYHSLQLFWLEYGSIVEPSNWELDVARILAALVTFYAAVRAVTAIFAEQLHAQRARFARNHVVVCGLGRGGALVAKGFRGRGDTVVAIERDPTAPAVRQCRDAGAVVLIGDASDSRLLNKAGVERAAELIVFCGDDAVTAEVAIAARDLVRGRRETPLRAHVHIVDYALRDLLEESWLGLTPRNDVDVVARDEFAPSFFNAAERGASALLDAHKPFDKNGRTAGGTPHLLVVGLGEMGANAIVHAALRWRVIPDVKPLPITVVDLHAGERIAVLTRRYPRLAEVCDLAVVDMDVRSPDFEGGDFLKERSFLRSFSSDGSRGPVTMAYVCLDEDGRGLTTALALRRLPALRDVPIVVRLTLLAGVSKLLERDPGLETFGVLERTCAPKVLLRGTRETLARAIHERYLRRKLEQGQELGSRPALRPWEELDEVYRESNRRQADDVADKLALVDARLARLTDWNERPASFSHDEVETLAQAEHASWQFERTGKPGAAGQLNPNFVPWDQLDEDARNEDRAMVTDLPVLLARVGYRIVR